MHRTTHTKLVKLCFSAVAIALEIVLNRFVSINTAGWKIGFAFLPPTFIAILFGPLWSAVVYGVSDLIGALLFPIGPYHPGFTICAALMGICCGLFLYQEPVRIHSDNRRFKLDCSLQYRRITLLWNVLPCVLINCLLIGMFINTTWVAMLYGKKTYWGWFLYRLPEYGIMIPVQLLLIQSLLKIKLLMQKSGLLSTVQNDKEVSV